MFFRSNGNRSRNDIAHTQPTIHPYQSVTAFINTYNERAAFFSESFIRKLTNGKCSAIAEVAKHPLPPSMMDLRDLLQACVKEGVDDHYVFTMREVTYLFKDLRTLVPQWARVAEKALIESDPALADKLMSRAQWNAKAAFEVTYLTAVTQLEELRLSKGLAHNREFYLKMTLAPLERALQQMRELETPTNALIGYVTKISIAKAITHAEKVVKEFSRLLAQ